MSSIYQLVGISIREAAVAVKVGRGVGCIQVAAGLEKSGGWMGVSRGARYGWESWAQREVSASGYFQLKDMVEEVIPSVDVP